MPDKEAEEEEDDAPDSEEPASDEPKAEEPTEAAKQDAKADDAEVEKAEPDEPVSKSVEWGLAIAMIVILVGFLFLMIHFMRSARSAVM